LHECKCPSAAECFLCRFWKILKLMAQISQVCVELSPSVVLGNVLDLLVMDDTVTWQVATVRVLIVEPHLCSNTIGTRIHVRGHGGTPDHERLAAVAVPSLNVPRDLRLTRSTA